MQIFATSLRSKCKEIDLKTVNINKKVAMVDLHVLESKFLEEELLNGQ